MKRSMPFDDRMDIVADKSSSDDVDISELFNELVTEVSSEQPTDTILTEEAVVRKKAEMYQNYMMQLPIPIERGAIVPFRSWTGFGKSMKAIYKQPLHYLTNVLLKQMDRNAMDASSAGKYLDNIIHPGKAEVFLWVTEEIHRLTTSPHQLAQLWLKDPMFKTHIDPFTPST